VARRLAPPLCSACENDTNYYITIKQSIWRKLSSYTPSQTIGSPAPNCLQHPFRPHDKQESSHQNNL
jgi:hypothetical protein